jgi:hypothetical protein
VPIHDYLDRVVAGLTIAGPTSRLNRSTMDHYVDLALGGGREIASMLGRNPAQSPDGHRNPRRVADASEVAL